MNIPKFEYFFIWIFLYCNILIFPYFNITIFWYCKISIFQYFNLYFHSDLLWEYKFSVCISIQKYWALPASAFQWTKYSKYPIMRLRHSRLPLICKRNTWMEGELLANYLSDILLYFQIYKYIKYLGNSEVQAGIWFSKVIPQPSMTPPFLLYGHHNFLG